MGEAASHLSLCNIAFENQQLIVRLLKLRGAFFQAFFHAAIEDGVLQRHRGLRTKQLQQFEATFIGVEVGDQAIVEVEDTEQYPALHDGQTQY